MIIQDFVLKDYDWYVKIYYITDSYPINDIYKDLVSVDADKEDIEDLIKEMKESTFNKGSIHTNIYLRKSIIIIGPTTSAEQFNDTLDHEKGHLAMHICIADDIDPFSEEYQYLAGEISRNVYRAAKNLLCEHCRKYHT